jgi:hypothetical protein
LVERHYADTLSQDDSIINFEKYHKATEIVLQTQLRPNYIITEVDTMQVFIEQSLASVDLNTDYWEKSVDVEPPKREKEKEKKGPA